MSGDPSNTDRFDQTVKSECSHCRGIRNCHVRGHFGKTDGNEDYSWRVDWYILQCCGCETVFARTISTNSEDYENYYEYDGSTGTRHYETINYWPALSRRALPEWLEAGIDADQVGRLNDVLVELYKALNNDLYTLAGIGIRTAFDVASSLLSIDENLSFQQKLAELEQMGKIGPQDKIRLTSLVEAGSASAHRGWKPTANDLNTMMDALEYFVHETFVIPNRKARVDERLSKMDESVPRRKAKNRDKS